MKCLGIFTEELSRACFNDGPNLKRQTLAKPQIPLFDLKRYCYNAAQQKITQLVIPDEEKVVCQIKNQSLTMA